MLDTNVVSLPNNDFKESSKKTNIEYNKFKQTEKNIRNYIKKVNALNRNLSKRQLNKQLSNIYRSQDYDSDFQWQDVVDVINNKNILTIDNSNIKKHLTSSLLTSQNNDSIVNECKLIDDYKVFDLSFIVSGLYLVSNALSAELQIHWAKIALEEYSKVEHTNLTNLQSLQDKNIQDITINNNVILSMNKDQENDSSNLWELSKNDEIPFDRFTKLRWSCLGYHYDWTMRMYRKNLKSKFPIELASLCKNIANIIDEDLEPEAAIINYYPVGTSMGGHLDDAEHTMIKPIISISLGCSAIFLIGGNDKNIKPIPILLRSGDAIIMSKESRYSYHGIPYVLPSVFQPLLEYELLQSPKEYLHNTIGLQEYLDYNKCYLDSINEFNNTKYVVDYLQNSRINMNIRQVRVKGDDAYWIDKSGSGASYLN